MENKTEIRLLWIIDKLKENNFEYYINNISKNIRHYLTKKKYILILKNVIICQKYIRMYLGINNKKLKINLINKIIKRYRIYYTFKIKKIIKIQHCFRNRNKDKKYYIKKLLELNKIKDLKYENINKKYFNLKNSMDNLICPISHEVPNEPIFCLVDGKIYDNFHIRKWLENHQTSPINRQIINDNHLISLVKLSEIWGNIRNLISPDSNSWWCDNNVINWVVKGNFFLVEENLSFIDKNPKERHQFRLTVSMINHKNKIEIYYDNIFKFCNNRIKYPFNKNLIVELKNKKFVINPCSLINGCKVDVLKNNELIYEQKYIRIGVNNYKYNFVCININNDENLNLLINPYTCQPFDKRYILEYFPGSLKNKTKYNFYVGSCNLKDILSDTGHICLKIYKEKNLNRDIRVPKKDLIWINKYNIKNDTVSFMSESEDELSLNSEEIFLTSD